MKPNSRKLLVLAPVLALAACGPSREEIRADVMLRTAGSLATHPDAGIRAMGANALANMDPAFRGAAEQARIDLQNAIQPRILNCVTANVDRRSQRAQASCTPAPSVAP